MKRLEQGVVSPQDWGLPVAVTERLPPGPLEGVGLIPTELEARARANMTEWLPHQYDMSAGALYGHYEAPSKRLEPFNTVNLIGTWQLIAAYDRGGDARLLAMARRAAEWFTKSFAVTHPMSVVVGGVRDTGRRNELWTKYAAEHTILYASLARRTGDADLLERARQSGGFLRRARRHGFAPRYDEASGTWLATGWQSFGRVVEACLEMERAAADASWAEEALLWGEHGMTLQADDGGFYLLDGEFYNSDIAADELRALCFLHERTGRADFLNAARAFGRWHLERERPGGSWPVNMDRHGEAVAEVVGPGDMSNISIAFLRLALLEPAGPWLAASRRALGYAYSRQAVPGSSHPYLEDPRVRWGFWSWDPYYDYTLSADQSTHHVRAAWFHLDCMSVDTGVYAGRETRPGSSGRARDGRTTVKE
jgi:hypothetical protein